MYDTEREMGRQTSFGMNARDVIILFIFKQQSEIKKFSIRNRKTII